MSLFVKSDYNSFRQLVVNAVASVFYGNYTSASAAGYDGDLFTAVTAERKQKGIKLFVIGFDSLNYIFAAFLCTSEIHISHRFVSVNL